VLPARPPCLPHRANDCNSCGVIRFNPPAANRDLTDILRAHKFAAFEGTEV
jgi:hypothetical protein